MSSSKLGLFLSKAARVDGAYNTVFHGDPNLNADPIGQARPRIGIITALPKETAAVMKVFGQGTDVSIPAGLRSAVNFQMIECQSSIDPNKKEPLVLAQCLKMGNNSAAVAATAMLMEFQSVTDVIMVGIAGGVPVTSGTGDAEQPDHVRLGDIVVSKDIVQYDFIKQEVDRHENRGSNGQPSAELLRVLNQLLTEKELSRADPLTRYTSRYPRGWSRPSENTDKLYRYTRLPDSSVKEEQIDHPNQVRPNRRPLVHFDVIGSANVLLKDFERRDFLKEKFKIKAVEMEGSGIADAAWHFGVGYLVVRGICDYCDPTKGDKWQKNAAYVAAAYTRIIVDKLIENRPSYT